MKLLIGSLLVFALLNSKCQTVYFGIKAAPDFTVPLGNENHVFWNFPQDSDRTFRNIKAKKQVFLDVAVMPYVKIEYPMGKVLIFTWTAGLGYYLTRYKISWTADYFSSTSNGLVSASYKINRNELGINLLPGIAYSNLRIEMGLNLLFIADSNVVTQFSEGGIAYIHAPEGFYHPIFNCSLPIYLSYIIPVAHKFRIEPFINCEFGIWNWDHYDLGNMPVFYAGAVSEFMAGVSFSLQIKKTK